MLDRNKIKGENSLLASVRWSWVDTVLTILGVAKNVASLTYVSADEVKVNFDNALPDKDYTVSSLNSYSSGEDIHTASVFTLKATGSNSIFKNNYHNNLDFSGDS